ncbi:MAG: VOC family protein [Pseudomonadota bacterium]
MPQLSAIDHLVLTVADMDATIAFYRALGLTPEEFGAADGTRRVAMVGQGFKLNLHPAKAPFAPHAATPVPGAVDVCFKSAAPLKSWLESGLDVVEGPVNRTGARGAMMSIYLRDPDGNLIEICSYD